MSMCILMYMCYSLPVTVVSLLVPRGDNAFFRVTLRCSWVEPHPSQLKSWSLQALHLLGGTSNYHSSAKIWFKTFKNVSIMSIFQYHVPLFFPVSYSFLECCILSFLPLTWWNRKSRDVTHVQLPASRR